METKERILHNGFKIIWYDVQEAISCSIENLHKKENGIRTYYCGLKDFKQLDFDKWIDYALKYLSK